MQKSQDYFAEHFKKV